MPTSTGTDPVVEFASAGSMEPPPPSYPRPDSNPSRRLPSWAIALLVVLGAGLLFVIIALGLVLAADSTVSNGSTSGTVVTTDTQPAEGQPADNQPAGSQPADTQPAVTQPADTQPADTQPAVTQPADTAGSSGEITYVNEPLQLRGIGAIEFGMSVEQAERIVGSRIVPMDGNDGTQGCALAQLENDTAGPRFMVQFEIGEFNTGRIVRAEIPAGMSTRSGIGIGSTKAQVLAAYGDRIQVTPHKYTFADGGEYLTFVPADGQDTGYRLIMETLNDQVTAIRAGELPAVELVEGCL